MTIRDHIVRLRPQLAAYARAISAKSDEADDLVHDAIERTLKTPDRPAELSDLRPWMFRIIRNLHVDGIRKAKVRA